MTDLLKVRDELLDLTADEMPDGERLTLCRLARDLKSASALTVFAPKVEVVKTTTMRSDPVLGKTDIKKGSNLTI